MVFAFFVLFWTLCRHHCLSPNARNRMRRSASLKAISFPPLVSHLTTPRSCIRSLVVYSTGHVGCKYNVPDGRRPLQGLHPVSQAQRLPEPPQHPRGRRFPCCCRFFFRGRPAHPLRAASAVGAHAPQGRVRSRGALELQGRGHEGGEPQVDAGGIVIHQKNVEGLSPHGYGKPGHGEGTLGRARDGVVWQGAGYVAAPRAATAQGASMFIAEAGIIMIMLAGAVLDVKLFDKICSWQGDNCIVAFLFLVCNPVQLCNRYASCFFLNACAVKPPRRVTSGIRFVQGLRAAAVPPLSPILPVS